MGIATIEVLANHFIQWTHANPLSGTLNYFVMQIIFPANVLCFLLLSGLGLFYSFSKNNDIEAFYKRRVQRVWLPFMIMVAPLYLIIAYHDNASVIDYVGWVTSIGYWFGNTRFWFIALSLVLYIIFPFCYKWMMSHADRIFIKTIVLSLGTILLSFSISVFFPDYFEKIQLSLPKTPIFFIGIYFGYLVQNSESISFMKYLSLLLGLVLLFFCISRIDRLFFNYVNISLQLITLALLCLAIERFYSTRVIYFLISVWRWIGRYSLELYILHSMFAGIVETFTDLSLLHNAVLVMLFSFILCKPSQLFVQKITNKML